MDWVRPFDPAVTFSLALAGSMAVMPVAAAVGPRLGLSVAPRLFGRGQQPVSYLGGAALALTICAVIAGVVGLSRATGALVVGAVAVLALGMFDDGARGGIPPLARLAVEATVATGVWAAGLRPEISGVPVLDLALTIFVLVASANAFNLLDNMDGVAGATAAVTAGGIVGTALLLGQPRLAGLAAATCGASLGFLRRNLRSRTLFLGNGGALFLGFLLGGCALMLQMPLPRAWDLVAAATVVAVPATDTLVVVTSRLAARRPIFEGGTDHLSHRLVRRGLTPRLAVLGHAAASGVSAAAVLGVAVTASPLILVLPWGLLTIAAAKLLKIRMYETVEVARRPYHQPL
jgi:UDP-GlcNAc:undecaprenyl-phosphate/decaprenyl-phosphate GlcNAc-1-phosphate transferase